MFSNCDKDNLCYHHHEAIPPPFKMEFLSNTTSSSVKKQFISKPWKISSFLIKSWWCCWRDCNAHRCKTGKLLKVISKTSAISMLNYRRKVCNWLSLHEKSHLFYLIEHFANSLGISIATERLLATWSSCVIFVHSHALDSQLILNNDFLGPVPSWPPMA